MSTVIGVVTVATGLFAWLGQTVTFISPATGAKLGILEPEDEIDPTLRIIEAEAEGLIDMLLVWVLPAAALLMLLQVPIWPYIALVGAGIYIYFSALIMSCRVYLTRHGRKVGGVASVRATYIFGSIWFATAVAMIVLAVSELSG
jgi:hypothetical protein